MIYLEVIKKYAKTFFTTFVYLSFLGLFYFFYLLLGMKFRGEQAILLEAFKNYALLLVHSLPLMAIFSTLIFFAKIESSDSRFMIRIMPLIGSLNTIVLLLFFFFRWDFVNFMHYEPLSIKPLPQSGYITPYGDVQVYLAEGKERHLVFTGDIYLASSWKTNASTLTLQASSRVGDASFTPEARVFSLSLKERAPSFQETGFTKIFFEAYFAYVRKLREVFFRTFYSWGVVSSLLGILFMSAGYFSLLAGISLFLKEPQIQMLVRSFLVLLGVAAWFSFPHFLSFISLMSFGIRIGLLRVAFPSLLMGVLATLVGYGILILKNGLPRKV
ncbi:MAG: hypothetical protein N2314_08280 [Brevinematales bacterium]|nr:hypothetical protein [Brevinematales bacterium]